MGNGAKPGEGRRAERVAALEAAAAERVLVLDSAMGTMIRRHELGEADFRGALYADHDHELAGNNDLLSIARPEIIHDIHAGYRHLPHRNLLSARRHIY